MTRSSSLLSSLLLLCCCFSAFSITDASYLPYYIEGVPLTWTVTALDPPDLRGVPVYRIDYTVSENATGSIVSGTTHRAYWEWEKFDGMVRKRKKK